MKKMKVFYGKPEDVEESINEFLERDRELVDIKQSLDSDFDYEQIYILYTLIYTEKGE